MVTIKRSEIQGLIATHSKDTYGISKTADVIAKLQVFLNSCASGDAGEGPVTAGVNCPDILTQEELYNLALILLKHEKSMRLYGHQKPTKNEVLAKKLENQFGEGKFKLLRNTFNENNKSITQEQFNQIVTNIIPTNDQFNLNPAAHPNDLRHPSSDTESLKLAVMSRTKSPDLPEQTKRDASPTRTRSKLTFVPAITNSPFLTIDGAILKKIARVSSLPGAMPLRQVSKSFCRLFSITPALSKHINTKPDLFRKLLGHVALGELGDAEAIWREHTDLLTCYGTIFHPNRFYSGDEVDGDIPFHHNPGRYQYNNRTPLQILWINEEYEEAKPIEEVVGPQEMARQFFEVFPDGVIKKDNFDLDHAKTLLNKVFEAIVKDSTINANNLDEMNEVTRNALYDLHDYAKPEFEHKTGLVFDPHFYLAALELYDKQADDRFKKNGSKFGFWSIRVEEWLAGCLATGYLRLHAQGIGNNAVHRRGCLVADESSYFAFRRPSHSLPGLHCFIGYYGGRVAAAWRAVTGRAHRKLSSIMSSKKHLSERLIQSCNSSLETNPRPVK